MIYLLDSIGVSRRSFALRLGNVLLSGLGGCWAQDAAYELPWTPAFLHKHGGLVLSIGQFNQWVGSRLMASGLVQIWPGTPVSAADLPGRAVARGCAWPTRGSIKRASPRTDSCRGWMSARALTVVGDGPVGAVGQAIDKIRNAAGTCAASGRWA